jgi:hypothetical protein
MRKRCLSIYTLFNNAFSSSSYIKSNERYVSDELERMWKETVVV